MKGHPSRWQSSSPGSSPTPARPQDHPPPPCLLSAEQPCGDSEKLWAGATAQGLPTSPGTPRPPTATQSPPRTGPRCPLHRSESRTRPSPALPQEIPREVQGEVRGPHLQLTGTTPGSFSVPPAFGKCWRLGWEGRPHHSGVSGVLPGHGRWPGGSCVHLSRWRVVCPSQQTRLLAADVAAALPWPHKRGPVPGQVSGVHTPGRACVPTAQTGKT